jgi:hypothetical protein
MTDEHEHEYGLVVSFPDQSASFTHGFEAGRLDQRMSTSETPIEECVHSDNEEVLRRLAEHQGYAVEWRASEVEGWSYIELRKVRPSGKVVNPHGLRVVS